MKRSKNIISKLIIFSMSFLVLLVLTIVILNGREAITSVKSNTDTKLVKQESEGQGENKHNKRLYNIDAYTSENYYYDDFILPESDSKKYMISDIEKCTSTALKLVEAQIYARHNCSFEDSYVNEYFEYRQWYVANKNINEEDVEKKLNEIKVLLLKGGDDEFTEIGGGRW